MPGNPAIQIRGLTKHYGEFPAVRGIDFEVQGAEVFGLLGAVAAWADGQTDTVALLAAVWAAAQTVFIRAGIANEVRKAQE